MTYRPPGWETPIAIALKDLKMDGCYSGSEDNDTDIHILSPLEQAIGEAFCNAILEKLRATARISVLSYAWNAVAWPDRNKGTLVIIGND